MVQLFPYQLLQMTPTTAAKVTNKSEGEILVVLSLFVRKIYCRGLELACFADGLPAQVEKLRLELFLKLFQYSLNEIFIYKRT